MKASILYVRFKGISLWKRNLLLRRSGDRRSRHFVDKKERGRCGRIRYKKMVPHRISRNLSMLIMNNFSTTYKKIRRVFFRFSLKSWHLFMTGVWKILWPWRDCKFFSQISTNIRDQWCSFYLFKKCLILKKITKAMINCIIAIYHWNQHFHAINFLTKCAWKRRRQLERIFMRKP